SVREATPQESRQLSVEVFSKIPPKKVAIATFELPCHPLRSRPYYPNSVNSVLIYRVRILSSTFATQLDELTLRTFSSRLSLKYEYSQFIDKLIEKKKLIIESFLSI
ncbi:MAG: hypothetical protein J7540_02240, partial [Roseofilum sp. SID2]